MILCSESGAVRYWDTVSLGLTGGENYHSSELGNASGERILGMTRADVGNVFSSALSEVNGLQLVDGVSSF